MYLVNFFSIQYQVTYPTKRLISIPRIAPTKELVERVEKSNIFLPMN